VLNTELTPLLLRKGLARDLIRFVNDRRKTLGCEYNDQIEMGVVSDDEEVAVAIAENEAIILKETQAEVIVMSALDDVQGVDVQGVEVKLGAGAVIYVRVVK
jgi:isoleucyl-tRNA synthetase